MMYFQLKRKEKKKMILAVLVGFLLIKSWGIATTVSAQEISENVEINTTSGAAIIETPTKDLEPVIQPVIESEKTLEITGEITPWIIAEDKDITSVEMNKITFPLKDTSSLEIEREKTIEQLYTLNVKGKGGLYLALASADQIPFQSLKLQIYTDSNFTKKIGKDYIVKANTKVIKNKSYYLPKAGTYYLRFTYYRSLEIEEDKIDEIENKVENSKVFGMTAAFLYSNNRTLKEGKNLVSYADDKKRAIYYKVNIKKDGLISYLAMPEDGTSLLSGYLQLCDEEKEPISVSEYVSSSEDNNQAVHAYYVVKKGTYYIKAELSTSYIASFTLEKVKDISGSSMERAKKLKLGGKEKKSVLFLSDQANKEKWFCFRLKKNQNFSIVVNSCVNGYLNIEVCNADKMIVKSGSINFHTGTKILKTSAKWQRGIYYIKISKEKESLKSSGYFSIKVED